jgi:hypothetical protein
MRILSTAGSAVRHGLGATVEAGLVVAIAATLVFGAAVVTRNDPAGAANVFAAKGGGGGGSGGGGSLSATISFAGYAPEPVSMSNPVTGTAAYPVLWPSWDSLVGGTYPHVFALPGTHCRALVTIMPWTAKPLGDAVMDYAVAP